MKQDIGCSSYIHVQTCTCNTTHHYVPTFILVSQARPIPRERVWSHALELLVLPYKKVRPNQMALRHFRHLIKMAEILDRDLEKIVLVSLDMTT